jgi:FkbM family methyltransferase
MRASGTGVTPWRVVLIGSALALVTALVATPYRSARWRLAFLLANEGLENHARLERTYGASKSSQFDEEWIVRDFFGDRREGVFLDVGANDYRLNNLTYYLETSLGWSGVAIDAQHEYAEGFRRHRPRTRFFTAFVSDTSDETVELHVPEQVPVEASADLRFAAKADRHVSTRQVPTVTLDDLLDRAGVARVDFMSMDIELAEPKALKGFSIGKFRPSLVCIEGHPEVRQAILDYFHDHGYVVVGKYLRTDVVNLYFMPAESSE